MNHKTQIDGDDEGPGHLAEGHPSVVSSAASAGWESLGVAVAAVVMRHGKRLPRLRVQTVHREEETDRLL